MHMHVFVGFVVIFFMFFWFFFCNVTMDCCLK